jgi:hypothetical protein
MEARFRLGHFIVSRHTPKMKRIPQSQGIEAVRMLEARETKKWCGFHHQVHSLQGFAHVMSLVGGGRSVVMRHEMELHAIW